MQKNKQHVLKNLDTISEYMTHAEHLVEEDAYCMDILKQTFAARQAIDALEQHLLEGHLQHCVPEGMKQGRSKEVIDELLQLYSMVGNRQAGQ
ncbi:metal-sensing transcriptional repressor [Ktedonospora formicarum]|uniref:Metal-sensing transcriptional repressor n=1 Tax=Ktedonospora formicarum TaxID=2778364 RepID=A0A8J3I7D9_9CHLR|nr:metal-sensing transcriptional repressor [Ktedonospora formicarum]GHO48811.1 hypothetical protein KSX_69740 [Ktedonospora formicarum]